MASVNLYRIENGNEDEIGVVLSEFEYIDSKKIIGKDDSVAKFELYIINDCSEKLINWNWVVEEFAGADIYTQAGPIGILKITKDENLYVATFGHAFFKVDKLCDHEFGFEIAKRLEYQEIKTTTMAAPHSKRNKSVSTYIDYNELEFDSGESFSKLKVKVKTLDDDLFTPSVEIGSSVKFNLKDNTLETVIALIDYIEFVLKKDLKYRIPIFTRVKDEDKVKKLESSLKAAANDESCKISISELDIIGANEVFNHNDDEFEIYYHRKKKNVTGLTIDDVKEFCKENELAIADHLFEIKIKMFQEGRICFNSKVHDLIDFTNDEERCLLSKGYWYNYNDDYINYLDDSISEIECFYNSAYDFSVEKHMGFLEEKYKELQFTDEYKNLPKDKAISKLKKKYYAEYVFNELMVREGFKNYDRDLVAFSGSSSKIELMDLYKDNIMFAVKLGNSSGKLTYVFEQSLISLKNYKNSKKAYLPKVDCVAVWLVLERKNKLPNTENGQPDLTDLEMLMLKNKMDSWKKEVRLAGYIPKIYINYKK